MQLLHFDSFLYSSADEALKEKNGVVILSFLFDIFYSAPETEFLSQVAEQVKEAGTSSRIGLDGGIGSLLAGANAEAGFYYYQGSLTRPPCSNTVTWIVYRNKLRVTQEQVREPLNNPNPSGKLLFAVQVQSLRGLLDTLGRNITKNFRKVQPLEGRRPLLVFK